MDKILAFGASNSKKSINKQLATYATTQLANCSAIILDLNDFEMPIYSIDREKELGIPLLAEKFKAHIEEADGILISLAEHNGAYTTAFKNILDWVSRLDRRIWSDKPMLLLSTSPGARGAKSVLQLATNSFKYMNRNSILTFSLPLFKQNFSPDQGIIDKDLQIEFMEQLRKFEELIDGNTQSNTV